MPKLRRHLLSRVLERLGKSQEIDSIDPSTIILKYDRMYHHNLVRVNYTTYDVRRAQDVINYANSHHNIMLLADYDSNTRLTNEADFYKYACTLGTYHVNVIYVGPGSVDYRSQRMEFLWVRWYDVAETRLSGWKNSRLDRLRFPPVTRHDAFGFVDPSDVLRGCHIIPRFSLGLQHSGGLSYSGKDSEDWREYYVNR